MLTDQGNKPHRTHKEADPAPMDSFGKTIKDWAIRDQQMDWYRRHDKVEGIIVLVIVTYTIGFLFLSWLLQ